ncbi:hypothetical protein D0867_11762 [Hortaea werneckii]|uniref:Uncharacterized protein n=2 Tax=Hortaea werneckii TaxID=91943 RepID=A0A3M6YBP5_HORWE|nr:hypothetical protein D0867_11762 [Hortaea werneckii]RMY35295.1 hypothetical protein D0866_04699 [Hortaea werneckii]
MRHVPLLLSTPIHINNLYNRPHWVSKMSLWTSYRALSTRTRLLIGGGIMTYAVAGMFLSDKAEQFFGFEPTDQDRKRLQDSIPKIHAVDREK